MLRRHRQRPPRLLVRPHVHPMRLHARDAPSSRRRALRARPTPTAIPSRRAMSIRPIRRPRRVPRSQPRSRRQRPRLDLRHPRDTRQISQLLHPRRTLATRHLRGLPRPPLSTRHRRQMRPIRARIHDLSRRDLRRRHPRLHTTPIRQIPPPPPHRVLARPRLRRITPATTPTALPEPLRRAVLIDIREAHDPDPIPSRTSPSDTNRSCSSSASAASARATCRP